MTGGYFEKFYKLPTLMEKEWTREYTIIKNWG
jgi:hypothetical protein